MTQGPLRKRSHKLFGFTLMELMVVVALIGGLISLVIPSVRALGGLDLKTEITKVAGLTSEVYALAALSGKTHRIVFDLDHGAYWVEEKEGEAGEIKPELGYDEIIKKHLSKENEKATTDTYLPRFKAIQGRLGEKIELPKGMVIYGAWTEQMKEIARTGQVSVYFFPGGYTQSCFVSLADKGDEEKTAIYLSLSPLTAIPTIKLGEPDINELSSAENTQGHEGEK